MARGVNKVIIIGNLGADPETRYTANGQAITSIRVATTDSWTDKTSGQKQEKTEWHRVKMFGRTAEIAGEYLKKGRQVYIEGRLETNKYTDKEGVERYSTEIVANDMQMIGGMGERGGAEMGAPRERPARAPAPQGGGRPAPAAAPAVADQPFDEDDIPF